LVIHFAIEGDIILKESNEYKIQEEIEDLKKDLITKAQRAMDAEDPGANTKDI